MLGDVFSAKRPDRVPTNTAITNQGKTMRGKIAVVGIALLGLLTAVATTTSYAGEWTEIIPPAVHDSGSATQLAQYGPGGSWVDSGGGAVPPGAFVGGQEGPPSYETLFVCRAMYNGSMQLGKVRPGLGACNFAYSGREVTVPSYQVLVGNYGWVPWNGRISHRAVQGGYDLPPQSPPLFVCQAPYGGGMHPGKTRPDWDSCDISWGGREIFVHGFAVLVQ
jgi:hypothetical protein